MNAIELLETLLRGPGGGGAQPPPARRADPRAAEPRESASAGIPQILRDILQGGAPTPAEPEPVRRPAPDSPMPSASRPPADSGPISPEEKAELREAMRQMREREAAAAAGRPYRPAPASTARGPVGSAPGVPSARPPVQSPAPLERDAEATLLIRAMINATRADGRLDREEEQKILRHLGQPSPDVVEFIQAEFKRPLDVKEFAWSVPLGLEQKVYAISLSVITLDQRDESTYLKNLAHGLRLPPDLCAEIHRQFGAPLIS